MCILCIREHIAALLQIYARYPIQQVTLQPQCHGRDRVDNGLTRLGHIDIEDLLAVDALQARLGPQCRDEPASPLAEGRSDGRLPDSPHGCYAIFARRQDCAMSVTIGCEGFKC